MILSFPFSRMAHENNRATAESSVKEHKPRSHAPIRSRAQEPKRQLGVERLEDRTMFAGDLETALVTVPYVDVATGNTTAEIGTILTGDVNGEGEENNLSETRARIQSKYDFYSTSDNYYYN